MANDADKVERLREFLRRLDAAANASNHDEAFGLIATILNQVENEMTTIPYNPDAFETDGRMYPPQTDSVRTVKDRTDIKRYRSRGHNTFIRDNGAIEIQKVTGEIIFEKPGKNGKGVWNE